MKKIFSLCKNFWNNTNDCQDTCEIDLEELFAITLADFREGREYENPYQRGTAEHEVIKASFEKSQSESFKYA